MIILKTKLVLVKEIVFFQWTRLICFTRFFRIIWKRMEGMPRCCLSGSPWRLAWHQKSSGSMPFEYAVDGSTSQTHTGSNSTLLNALTGKCKHLMPNTHRGWTGHCSNSRKNFWKNMQILIQSCHSVKIDLGERPPILWFRSSTFLTLHWMSAQGSVGFRWWTITGPYHANFSQVETQKFDPRWFYCLKKKLFCQECSRWSTVAIGILVSIRKIVIKPHESISLIS